MIHFETFALKLHEFRNDELRGVLTGLQPEAPTIYLLTTVPIKGVQYLLTTVLNTYICIERAPSEVF